VEIRELRVFIAVAEEGSLSAAVRKLHLSQSALSQTILSPERQLGVPLPDGVTWYPLTGSPVVRRTWAVWPASARRRDLAALVAALDLTMR
jgi:DNA-binding transcriptional LysR family regulator